VFSGISTFLSVCLMNNRRTNGNSVILFTMAGFAIALCASYDLKAARTATLPCCAARCVWRAKQIGDCTERPAFEVQPHGLGALAWLEWIPAPDMIAAKLGVRHSGNLGFPLGMEGWDQSITR
jgi:hypothetical protein